MTPEEKLKSVKVSGSLHGVTWLNDLSDQAARTAAECDSSFHEIVAITLRRAADDIRKLEGCLNRVKRELDSF